MADEQRFPAALPEDRLSLAERSAVFLLLSFFVIFLVGMIAIPQLFWDDFLGPLVWDPILQDAGGDAGYTPQNTALFIIVMFTFVAALAPILRLLGLPADGRTLMAFLPWVIWAPVIRVLEDTQFFQGPVKFLFISPNMHFHIAAWVIIAMVAGHLARRQVERTGSAGEDPEGDAMRLAVLVLLVMQFVLLYLPSLNTHEGVGSFIPGLGLMLAVITAVGVLESCRDWNPIQRSMVSAGYGSVVLGLGFWIQFALTPWHQSSPTSLWPILLILAVPGFICWVLWKRGRDSLAELEFAGLEAGVLPPGIGIKQHENGDWEGKDVLERLTPAAILATPWALTIAFGQLTDGLATWVGIDYHGYGEKHPLSEAVIELGKSISGTEMGAWLFFLTKAALLAVLLWVFTALRIENRQRHLRLLVVLALLVVGLAPGLRDLGRMLLGV